jgi:hypothetical protein
LQEVYSVFRGRLVLLPAVSAAAALLFVAHGATAQSANGTITGRVLWGNCIRAIPLPAAPDAQAQPVPGPGGVAPQTSGLPAGAVLVAVQNTSVSARTDEAGRFTLSSVPAGQYLTVAAGPVANATSATAERPNVFVNGGQSVDIGTLSLGGPTPLGIACRFVPGVGAVPVPDTTAPGTDNNAPPPGPDNTQPAPDTAPTGPGHGGSVPLGSTTGP